MDMKNVNKLVTAVQIILAIAGIAFLCVSIFGDIKGNWPLCTSLVCILIYNLIIVVRTYRNKRK